MVAAPSFASATDTVPRLQNGDRLDRFEFERRYEADPDVRRAELIEGVVYVSSPVNHTKHGQPHFGIIGWLAVYIARSGGTVSGGDNSTVRLDLDNDPQPDALLRYVLNGSSRLVMGYIEGPPELVVEVAASSVAIDLHAKKKAYRRNGVSEYIVWRTEDQELDWFSLEGGEYVPLAPDEQGVIASRVFPGLRLAVARLLSGDLQGVLDEQMRR
jgi:Uma2 family endonuclease